VIEAVMPDTVVTVETRAELLPVELFPQEEAVVRSAVEKRRRDFVTGRACARLALERLGVDPGAIGSGPRGEPLWPAGVVGSITHCRVLRACAVARSREVRSVGVDAEVHEPLAPEVLEEVSSSTERRALARAPNGVCLDRVLFSAKEAIYKAWWPLAFRWLGFEDVALSLSVRERTFRGQLLVPGPKLNGRPLTEFCGRWAVNGDVVVVGVVVSA
jgi:4'-phosphopantetheinyl transferase EntD